MGDAVGLLKLTWLLGCQRSAVVLGNNTCSARRALQGNMKIACFLSLLRVSSPAATDLKSRVAHRIWRLAKHPCVKPEKSAFAREKTRKKESGMS
jgi:hypothetical protein